MERKHLLYKSKVEYMDGPGVYTMNHVLGCSHGCTYCYAYRMAKRFGQVQSYKEWCHPQIVDNTLELLDEELRKKRKEPIRRVFMSFMTDPFPTAKTIDPRLVENKICDLSVNAIKLINCHGIPVTTLSKGLTPKELIGLHPGNEFGATMTDFDVNTIGKYERNTIVPWERYTRLRMLSESGSKTWISIEPFGLMVKDRGQDGWMAVLKDILDRCYFVDRVVFGKANYIKTAYKDPVWYRECADVVREFCSDRNIECIIKKGTEE